MLSRRLFPQLFMRGLLLDAKIAKIVTRRYRGVSFILYPFSLRIKCINYGTSRSCLLYYTVMRDNIYFLIIASSVRFQTEPKASTFSWRMPEATNPTELSDLSLSTSSIKGLGVGGFIILQLYILLPIYLGYSSCSIYPCRHLCASESWVLFALLDNFLFSQFRLNDGGCGELISCCGDRVPASGGQDLSYVLPTCLIFFLSLSLS